MHERREQRNDGETLFQKMEMELQDRLSVIITCCLIEWVPV